jgi:excisionase family DNA binding protein
MATVIEGIKFYTIPEAAKALRVTAQTVRAYLKQGRLKGTRIGRPILITERNLREFIGLPEYLLESEYLKLDETRKEYYVKASIGGDSFYTAKDRATQIKSLQEKIRASN